MNWVDDLQEKAPGFHGIHFMSPDVVEECWRLERQSFQSIAFANMSYLPSFTEWFLAQDLMDAYRIHHDALQLISVGSDQRWVLKSPAHLLGLDALMAFYPDALIIQTHRDPRTTIASTSSLSMSAGQGTSTGYTAERVGRAALEQWSLAAHRFTEASSRYNPDQFLDVSYDDFVRDGVGVVESIHRHFDLGWSPELESVVTQAHEESKVSERRPVHRYQLEDYGLTLAEVEAAFEGYLGRYPGVPA